MKSYWKIGLLILFAFMFGIPLSFAYYPKFIFNQETVVMTVSSLNTSSQNISVSPDPSISFEEGEEQYSIRRKTICNEYDEQGINCIDNPPNLCPYISLTPNDGEIEDVSLALNATLIDNVALGQINLPLDNGDSWSISVTPACFEGECPSNYDDFINGNPLPQALKGSIFECNLEINSTRPPVLVKDIGVKKAEAALSKTLHVSAVIQGGVISTPIIDPVIIIPGIMGSAYKNNELVIDPILHTYDDLIATLDANGYTKEEDLFTFPYEWRDSNALNANLLEQKIAEVKQICNCSKVDLVAHSMGGLIARQYIQSSGYNHDIDQVIFLGTPHKGSPKAYLQWEAGKFPSELNTILNESFFEAEALRNGYTTIFDYIRNRPVLSVKELLPVFDYLKDKNTGILRPYPNNYPQNNFLESLNNNISNLLDSGVRITNIVGNSGPDTIEKIRVVNTLSPTFWEHGEPDNFNSIVGDNGLEKGIGDRTVTIEGVRLDFNVNNYFSSSTHNRIVTDSEAKIFNILTNKVATTTFDHGFQLSPKVLLIQLLSPVDFVVTAPNGKKIGKNFSNGNEYNEIPEAFYSGYQTDNEYITILNPISGEYKLELQATGNGGKYTVMTNYISESTSTKAVFVATTTPGQVNNLSLQVSNTENIFLDPDIVADINTAYGKGWIKDKKTRDLLLVQAKILIRFDKKTDIIMEKLPNGSKKQKKVERVVKVVDKILAKLVLKQLDDLLKKKQITQEGYNLLKTDLNWIINH